MGTKNGELEQKGRAWLVRDCNVYVRLSVYLKQLLRLGEAFRKWKRVLTAGRNKGRVRNGTGTGMDIRFLFLARFLIFTCPTA